MVFYIDDRMKLYIYTVHKETVHFLILNNSSFSQHIRFSFRIVYLVDQSQNLPPCIERFSVHLVMISILVLNILNMFSGK